MLVSGLLLSTTSSGFEKRERIDRHARDAHLEMEVLASEERSPPSASARGMMLSVSS